MIRILVLARMVWLELFRRKDPYVLLLVLAALLGALLSFNIFGLGSLVRYIEDSGLLLTWLLSWVLAVQLAGRFRSGRTDVAARHDDYLDEAYAE